MKTVLLVKTSSLGDVIHNLPVVNDIRRTHPELKVDWALEASFASLLNMHPGVQRVLPLAWRRWRYRLVLPSAWRQMRQFYRTLRETSYHAVIDTQGLVKSGVVTRMALGPRYGYDAESIREPWAARFYQHHQTVSKSLHAVERNRRLVAQVLGYSIDELSLDYGLKAAPLFAPWLPQQPYVVCLSATSRDDKLWPENDWVALGKELNRRGLFCVFPAGSPKERARAARLVAAIPGAVAAPSLALTELARLLAGAKAVVGVDTGLTHLAAAVGRPVIALFTASDPVKTGVYASTPIANLGNLGVVPAVAQVLDQLQTWQIV